MNKLEIKSMHLVNFKGIRDLKIEFSRLTIIKGRNGLGKTTIFDAFTWLMFGKNSEDAKAFSIKTLDENGNVIPKIPHEVSATLEYNDHLITLTRRYNEKWTKKKGSAVEEFTGHEEERLFNDVPCSVKDWNAKIEEICNESTFKMITNPTFFTSQKKDAQRAMLFQMAEGVEDSELAEGNEDFKALLEMSTGKTLEEFKKEIGAKKKRVKAEIDGIPERIDERKREPQPEGNEYDSTHLLEIKQNELAELDKTLADVSSLQKANEEKINERSKRIFDLKSKIDKRKRDIEVNATKEYYQQNNVNLQLQSDIERIAGDKANMMDRRTSLGNYIKELNEKSNKLREQWYAINAKELVFAEGDFVCPTCGRPLEVADIEAKQAEMTARFNAQKAEELASINQQGKTNKALIEAKSKEVEDLENKIADADHIVEVKKSQITDVPKPDTDALISSDAEIKAMEEEIEKVRAEVCVDAPSPRADILEKKAELAKEIDYHKKVLADYERHKQNMKRIMELEEQMKNQAVELARLEGIEFNIQQFTKAKINAVEDKINSLFAHVKFKLYETQINGGEVETCEAMVDGVPFSDLNNAGRINAGLDIINAIIKAEQICAPIFVDNSESINVVQMGPSQYILLRVTEDETLTIE